MKENNILLSGEPTSLLLPGNVDYSDKMRHSFMVEGSETKNKESIGKFKDDGVFLLNDVESNFHDKPIEICMEKQKYEQADSE